MVSDEIYSNSIFPGEQLDSVAKVMNDRNLGQKKYMGDFVHVCAGFSKDFAINGFRVGTLFTHNQDLLQAMGSVGYF